MSNSRLMALRENEEEMRALKSFFYSLRFLSFVSLLILSFAPPSACGLDSLFFFAGCSSHAYLIHTRRAFSRLSWLLVSP